MNASLVSFDVFDTVLTRMVGQPRSVFLFVGYRAALLGHWPHSSEQFAAARVAAESQARDSAHSREVSLQEIYAQMTFAYGLSAQTVRACIALEIEIETALIRPVPAARCEIEEFRRQGHQLAFISDMYLPSCIVTGWLTSRGLMKSGDVLWMSSELGVTKSSGELFRHIRRHRNAAGEWRHFGDHPVSDKAVPDSLGIKSTIWSACCPTRYEVRMESNAAATRGLASLLAGASRWVRLSQHAATPAQVGMRDIAAGVAGPVLWAFVAWVLRSAQSKGLRRIWFVARDGQIMLRMARRIALHLGIDIDMGYLYAGRQVVHLAGLRRIDERALGWMTGGAGVVTAAAILERVGLTSDAVGDALRRYDIPRDGPIGWTRSTALEAFFRDGAVQSAVLEAAGRRYDDVRGYFDNCGLIDSEPCAIVDIGWRGSVVRSMFDIMGSRSAGRHSFLYFGLYGRPPDLPEANMSAFCFDSSGATSLGVAYDVPSLTSIMEVFCQADHAQVINVERRDGAFIPTLRPSSAASPTLWDVGYFQQCLELYADSVLAGYAIDPGADLRPVCGGLLRDLMAAPTLAEATVLGSVQYVDDQSGAASQAFARPFDLSDIRVVLRDGKLPQKALAWWEEGAWALTPRIIRLCVKAARRMRRRQ